MIAPIFVGAALASVAESFQWPALSATVPLMASEDDLPRYNGFLESGRAASMLAGPAIGGFLFALVGLPGLVSIELATFAIATFVVAGMAIPRPEAAPPADEAYSLMADAAFGFKWIYRHRPMFKFLLVATFANFWISIAIVLMAPYGLSFLSERSYGITSGLFGAGMILGGLIYGVASKRFTNAQQFLWTALILGVVYVAYGFSRDIFTLGGLNVLIAMMMTIGNGAIMTIWQTRVPDELQGRVLSAMRLVADITAPIAFVLAGPIADKLVPALYDARAASVWGSSETAQMGALFSVLGIVLFVGFAIAMTIRDVRRVEDVAL